MKINIFRGDQPDISAKKNHCCRAAASPLIDSARKVCKHEMAVKDKFFMTETMEADYVRLYQHYQELVHQLKGCPPCEKGSQSTNRLHKCIVDVVEQLNYKASHLLALRSTH